MSSLTFYDLIGKNVRVNQEGPEARDGRLLHLHGDFLVLQTQEEGIVYYNMAHVKSVSEKPSKRPKVKKKVPKYLHAGSFWGVLSRFIGNNIQLNRGGPDKVVGKLLDIRGNHLIVQRKKEKMIVPYSHIKNVSLAKGK
jgi:spore coat protein B